MRIHLVLFVILLLASSASCQDEENKGDNNDQASDIKLSTKSAEMVEADNRFGLELFDLIIREQGNNNNLMISPLSISLALAMTYNGAEGNTKAEMEEIFHKKGMTSEMINSSYLDLVKALESHDPKVEMSIANAIFYNKQFSVKTDFLNTCQKWYDARVEGLDFSNNSATVKTVNSWVSENTKNKIDRILDQVNPLDVMYLLNAIYFNGKWTYQFDTKNTKEQSFLTEERNELKVQVMQIKETFKYTEKEQFELIELPYGYGKYSMLVFLPKQGYKANDVARLLNPADLADWSESLVNRKISVYLPKFEFTFEEKLIPILQALGMQNAFSPENANFNGVSENSDLYVSDVIHKTYIKLDESGTEAAAVTGVTFTTTSAGPEQVFRVDHPFVFAIREKDTQAILFIGKVTNPHLKE